jgi:hypothetical protein
MQRIERKAIMKKLLSRLSAVGGLMVVVQLIFSSVAIASQPIIEADVVCEEDSLYVTYTATAWEGWPGNPDSRLNPAIEIYVDGILVHTGAFTDPNYAFSGSIPLPAGLGAGDTLPVMALAAAPWGTGLPGDNTAPGGSSDSVTVTVPDDECGGVDLGTGRFTGGGNKFHMTEHIETVACSDDPNIHQAPPDAPLDTLIGIGTGRYNGTDGYTIEFTLVDYGEPGSNNDRMSILIYETANPSNVALDHPLLQIIGGNLQAHYDQPHK